MSDVAHFGDFTLSCFVIHTLGLAIFSLDLDEVKRHRGEY